LSRCNALSLINGSPIPAGKTCRNSSHSATASRTLLMTWKTMKLIGSAGTTLKSLRWRNSQDNFLSFQSFKCSLYCASTVPTVSSTVSRTLFLISTIIITTTSSPPQPTSTKYINSPMRKAPSSLSSHLVPTPCLMSRNLVRH